CLLGSFWQHFTTFRIRRIVFYSSQYSNWRSACRSSFFKRIEHLVIQLLQFFKQVAAVFPLCKMIATTTNENVYTTSNKVGSDILIHFPVWLMCNKGSRSSMSNCRCRYQAGSLIVFFTQVKDGLDRITILIHCNHTVFYPLASC